MKKKIYTLLILAFFIFNIPVNAQNNALHFDGTDDYVISSQYINLSFQSYAIEGWFKADIIPSAGEYPHIFGIANGPTDAGFLRINGDSQKLEFVMKSAAGYKVVTSPEVIQADKWYHAAIMLHHFPGFDDYQYLLINGEVVAYNTFTSIGTYSNYYFGIGGDGDRYFDGQVDDVKVWANIARSSQDVRESMYKEVVGNESNLMAYYNLDETSGSTANDSQTNGTYDGTLTNMTGNEWIPSPAFFGPKNCLNFDGDDDNVWCSSITPTVTSGSIEFWVNLDVIPADNARLISRHSSYGYDEIYLLNNDGRIYTAGSFVVGDNLQSTNPLPTDVWTHVAITADGSGSKLYINGILDDTGGAADFDYDTFRFGGQYTAGFYEGIDGMMEEVRLWNDIRTESEIRENMYKSLVGDEDNLVAYFNLDNVYGAIAQSYPAEANDGSIGGGPTWVTSTAFNTWLNTDNSAWGTAANWSNGVPSSTDNVGIYNFTTDPIVSSTADCNDLFIELGASLTLEPGSSILTAGTITNNGTFNMGHTMVDDHWHLVSSPVDGATANVFFGDYLQYFDETLITDNYIDIDDETMTLNACQGYAWRNYSKGNFTFTGTPHNGDQSIVTTADQTNGWNLVGNPYPSSIDWNLLDDTYGTVYTFSDNGTNNGWGTYNDGAIVNNGSRYIAPMQGFMISTASAGSFAVTNASRTHLGADGYVKSKKELQQFVKLQLTTQDKMDETFIQIGDDYEEGFDRIYDGWKMQASDETSLQLFSKCSDGNLCIDRRPETETIPLGMIYHENTIARIAAVETADLQNIQLEDTKLNIFHDLSLGAYEFNWDTSDSEERFILHLKATGIDDFETQNTEIFAYQKTIHIRSSEKLNNAQINIIDMMGRVVYEQMLVDGQNESITVPLEDGVYLVQLISDSGTLVEKVVLK